MCALAITEGLSPIFQLWWTTFAAVALPATLLPFIILFDIARSIGAPVYSETVSTLHRTNRYWRWAPEGPMPSSLYHCLYTTGLWTFAATIIVKQR